MSRAPGLSRALRSSAGSASVIAFLLVSCGGGGGGGSDAVPCTTLSFDRALATPSNGDVYVEQSAGTCSTIDISVVISNLTGIFTAGFDLSYPSALVQYDSYTLGPVLQEGPPSTPPAVIVNPVAGGIQVTATRFSPDPDVDAVGSESLLVLRFRKVAPGAGAIDFLTGGLSTVSEVVVDENGIVRPAVFTPGHGGMLTVP